MKTRFFALAALALSLAACTQDEAGFLPEGAEGTPIVFTATRLNPAATAIAGTRAPVDGNWTGVQSVAVLMDGTVKTYNVTSSTADPTSATLTSTDPYYWTNHNDITAIPNYHRRYRKRYLIIKARHLQVPVHFELRKMPAMLGSLSLWWRLSNRTHS